MLLKFHLKYFIEVLLTRVVIKVTFSMNSHNNFHTYKNLSIIDMKDVCLIQLTVCIIKFVNDSRSIILQTL